MPRNFRPRLRPVASLLALGLVLASCGGGGNGNPALWLAPPPTGAGSPDSAPPPPPPAAVGQALSISTHEIASKAKALRTPGTAGVKVDASSKLATQFGGTEVDLNRVRYTRYGLEGNAGKPVDAVLIAVPGTLAASHSYLVLAENLVWRMWKDHGKVVELWGIDRRSVLLEDTKGLQIAERERKAEIGLDFLYGAELGLSLDPRLDRRAVFHDSTDVPFIADWTPQVHSIDIDAVVDVALTVARNRNVFLGGHSAGTGFVARYAATDFNLSGSGPAQPGYAKLKGLVLFEGAGASLAATPPTDAQLDAVIAAAEGGLHDAVATGKVQAFVSVPGLTPRVNASTEVTGMQIAFEGTINGTQALLQTDQRGIADNNVYSVVTDFTKRAFPVTAGAALGTFMDDDNLARTVFYSISLGALGDARADGVRVWLDNDTALPASAFRDFGPMPATIAGSLPAWGKELEPTNLKRFSRALFLGDTTYSDWYYPSSGLLIGNSAAGGGANLGLDTSALSLPVSQGGRGRADIVNQTQARRIDIPVIAFGGSNGLSPVPGVWRGFAEAIAPCAAPSCVAGTPRTPAGQAANLADRKFGDVAGGFEVHISEGYTHVDILTADDGDSNKVVRPLADFIERNIL